MLCQDKLTLEAAVVLADPLSPRPRARHSSLFPDAPPTISASIPRNRATVRCFCLVTVVVEAPSENLRKSVVPAPKWALIVGGEAKTGAKGGGQRDQRVTLKALRGPKTEARANLDRPVPFEAQRHLSVKKCALAHPISLSPSRRTLVLYCMYVRVECVPSLYFLYVSQW
jgi:hypothetical protein